ncbi:hypothetical protein [Cohnella mopanensis]|uniref:hypothetical protein n=1 Tax=Cohnella mopanensis TaxID=2911966 RepID=UPI001EF7CAD5|nr:hypothetical protein [Cohnella mopanensis]
MRKMATILLFAVILAGCSSTGTNNPNKDSSATVVRDVSWGMTMGEVKKRENSDPVEEHADEGYLIYNDSLFGMPVQLIYDFDKDKLHGVEYDFESDNTSFDQLLEQYLLLREKLSEKYGDPSKDNYDAMTANQSNDEILERMKRLADSIQTVWMIKDKKTKVKLNVSDYGGGSNFLYIVYSNSSDEEQETKL